MTPPFHYRLIKLALLLAICAVILSARLLLSYAHHVETVPPSTELGVSSGHQDELPPLW